MNENFENAKMIGTRLKQAREKAGMNRKDLERAVGISADSIKEWEYGKHIPSVDKVASICNCLGISADPILATGVYRGGNISDELDEESYAKMLGHLELKDFYDALSELRYADKKVVICVALETARQLKSRQELG